MIDIICAVVVCVFMLVKLINRYIIIQYNTVYNKQADESTQNNLTSTIKHCPYSKVKKSIYFVAYGDVELVKKKLLK